MPKPPPSLAFPDDAAAFFAAVYEPSDIVEVRLLPSKHSHWGTAGYWASPAGLAALGLWSDQNIYVGACPRKSTGDKDDLRVALARCVFVDFDGVSVDQARAMIQAAGLPQPTMLISSGGGAHAYWRLDDPITDLAAWTRIQQWLIARCGSDRTIKNPSRIMRLPGSINRKPGRDNAVCRLAEYWEGVTHSADSFGMADEDVARPAPVPVGLDAASPENMARQTLLFLAGGAGEGERNARLFAAACDLCGLGYGLDAAESLLGPPAERCGLEPKEIRAAIKSAYAKGRSPAKPVGMSDEDFMARLAEESGAAGLLDAGNPPAKPAPRPRPQAVSTVEDEPGTAVDVAVVVEGSGVQAGGMEERCALANILETTVTEGEKKRKKLLYKDVGLIVRQLLNFTGGWPKVCGDHLFVLDHRPQPFGPQYAVRWLATQSEFFGWLHSVCDVRWAESDSAVVCKRTGSGLSPVTKSEFFSALRRMAPDRYIDIATLPHHEPVPGTYYVECRLPQPSGGEALDELVAGFNAATPMDAALLRAAIVTMGWGGPCGSRPAFMLEADQPGAGKTSTVHAIAEVWGGAYVVDDPQQTWEAVGRAWMSSAMSGARAILFDNVKALVGGTSIEASITSPTVSGHRLYVGTIMRPNTVTTFVTVNGGRASEDMATRLVVVKMGRPNYSAPWQMWRARFMADRRWHVVADCLAELRGEQRSPIGTLDRFAEWLLGVVAKRPDGEAIAAHIHAARAGVDGDTERAEALCHALTARYRADWGLDATRRVAAVGDSGGIYVAPCELYCAAVDGGAWEPRGQLRRDRVPPWPEVQTFMRFCRRYLARRGMFPKFEGRTSRRVKVWDAAETKQEVIVARFNAEPDYEEADLSSILE